MKKKRILITSLLKILVFVNYLLTFRMESLFNFGYEQLRSTTYILDSSGGAKQGWAPRSFPF